MYFGGCISYYKQAEKPDICNQGYYYNNTCVSCGLDTSYCNNCTEGTCKTCPERQKLNPLSGGCHI